MIKLVCKIFLFSTAMIYLSAWAGTPSIPLSDSGLGYIGKHAEVLADPSRALTIEDIASQDLQFVPLASDKPNLGISQSIYWLRFTVDAENYDLPFWFLLQDFQFIHEMELYIPGPDHYSVIRHLNENGGSSRIYNTRSIVFRVPTIVSPTASNYYYLRLNSFGNAVDLDIKWSSEKRFVEYTSESNFFFGAFYGALTALLAYNFFLFVFIRDSTYIAYVYYMLSFVLMFFYINGYLSVFTNIDPTIDQLSALLLFPLHGALVFSRRVLGLEKNYPRLMVVFRLLEGLTLLSILLAVTVLPQALVLVLSVVLNPIVMLTLLGAGIFCIRKGYRPAKYYMIGWSVMIPLVILYGLNASSLVPSNLIATYGLQFAGIWEAILFSIALASMTREVMAQRDAAMIDKKLSKRFSAYTNALLENERKLIASEIHDSFNATLVAIKYKLTAIKQRPGLDDIYPILDSLEKLVGEKYSDARQLVKRLRPESIDMLGISSAIIELVNSYNVDHAGCQFSVTETGEPKSLDDDTAITVYRIVSECLTNVVKHSKATICSITMTHYTHKIRIEISDNGIGFNPKTEIQGIGLISIKERLEAIDGKMKVESTNGGGTKIVVEVNTDS